MASGTLISSPIRPISASMSFPVAYADEIKGGLHSVSNTSDRDLIPRDRREFGMLVYIQLTNEFYQLLQINSSDEFDNLNWALINFGGDTTTWINPVITRTSIDPSLLSPSIGDRYLIVSGTGAWFGYDNYVAEWNGSWQFTTPIEALTLRVNDEVDCIYCYVGGVWVKQSFVTDTFVIKYDITPSENIIVATNSEYFLYGDLNVDGQLDVWGKLVVANGTFSGTGSINPMGGGTIQQVELLTEIYGGTGVSISASASGERVISTNLISGGGIDVSLTGSSWIIGTVADLTGGIKYYIGVGETVSVPDYYEYFIYGDLEVAGFLDIGTYGKVVVVNGGFIASTGGSVSNMGNVEVYDLLQDTEIKIDITELKYGKAGRILWESELKFVPSLGTYARVVTESDDLVYSTSSAWLTSTASLGFDPYLGISTIDPLKKLHVNGSGIIINGSESEQESSLGDLNYARLVIDTESSDTQTFTDFRSDLGRVLWVEGGIEGGNRFPSVSIGTYSNLGNILNVADYYGNNFLSVSRLGTVSFATVSSDLILDKFLVWDDATGVIKYRDLSSSGKYKSNIVMGASFSGNPLVVSITFSTPYSTTDYSVTVTGEVPRTWSIENKTVNGFDINSNSSKTFSEGVYWYCIAYGEN